MKIAVYNCRPDEVAFFEQYAKEYGAELKALDFVPLTAGTAHLAAGCDAVSIITTPVGREILDIWHGLGVRVISTRTVGYEHVDTAYAESLGIPVANVSYTPNTVAEYTVMAILMCLRRMKTIMVRYAGQDFSLADIRGRELKNLTVGVIGTGRIGQAVIRDLSGFGCRILAQDCFESPAVSPYAQYVDRDTLLAQSDVVTIHVPSTPDTVHMINRDSIAKMKDGAIFINMARGSLVDTGALIDALESRKISAAALDVVEGETAIYYKDYKYTPTGHHDMAVLQAMPNVLMTPHTAFFTDEAVGDMVRYSIQYCVDTFKRLQ